MHPSPQHLAARRAGTPTTTHPVTCGQSYLTNAAFLQRYSDHVTGYQSSVLAEPGERTRTTPHNYAGKQIRVSEATMRRHMGDKWMTCREVALVSRLGLKRVQARMRGMFDDELAFRRVRYFEPVGGRAVMEYQLRENV